MRSPKDDDSPTGTTLLLIRGVLFCMPSFHQKCQHELAQHRDTTKSTLSTECIPRLACSETKCVCAIDVRANQTQTRRSFEIGHPNPTHKPKPKLGRRVGFQTRGVVVVMGFVLLSSLLCSFFIFFGKEDRKTHEKSRTQIWSTQTTNHKPQTHSNTILWM